MNPVQRPRLLFYVQHLLGIGHLKRAALLVQGLCRAGVEVYVVSGGEPVPGVSFEPARLVQLPILRSADSDFSALADHRGQPLDEAFKARRRAQLLGAFERIRPDLLLIESYPFGRRQLRWELRPLLEAAHRRTPRPWVLCSLRDILQARKPERIEETVALVKRYVDRILVHGDPCFIPLEASFPREAEIAERVVYTGYVSQLDPWHPSKSRAGTDEVIVSAGGGAVGAELLACALRARPLSRYGDRVWRLLAGPNLPREALQRLTREAADQPGVELEPLRADFRQLLYNCRLSVSQAGYNTIMDLLVTGARGLLVPFEGTGETEQRLRTERLAALGQVAWLSEAELSPERVAERIEILAARPASRSSRVDLDGARNTAEYIRSLWHNTHRAGRERS